ncbi:2-C-methyl-D-erythritol 4-phosphate cytidylyltransferase [Vibrio rumoiensis]|uniref:2-C-methyl-D-erythritol 4-phosphate cytidylyltransferase n=1 Tax=Vibrio rumoiensis 1S-45 TaxID=1188252 RepID=A0A1E5E4P3_9VIBR|nr:2-C-methyl-D-erythritol 4-phosphate cytidylyltransferase [Vibrio rumoiensis]OEF27796.1 2-C-methyl-D-erythritol 4-phosphate cytidylyltransferase [Vibrio rumoiensis 1S-45]
MGDITTLDKQRFAVVVPAAGVGKRMQANHPKQYLPLLGKAILEHTVECLLAHPKVELVVLAISEGDEYFADLDIATHPQVIRVAGGQERADSVLSGLSYLATNHAQDYPWVLVHDAARPCITHADITKLIEQCVLANQGGILATPVRDTMKQSFVNKNAHNCIEETIDRSQLWHALTPQMFPLESLESALSQALQQGSDITDEASAMELIGQTPLLVQGRADNIKITQPEDLALAAFFLTDRLADPN